MGHRWSSMVGSSSALGTGNCTPLGCSSAPRNGDAPQKSVAFPGCHNAEIASHGRLGKEISCHYGVIRGCNAHRAAALGYAIASPVQLFNHSILERFSLISLHIFCHSRSVMRLLVELLVIAALIFYGWTTPFKDHVVQVNRTITTKLNGLGGKLQKHQDPSVRRY